MTVPLRIGVLGAARIADDGIVEPARALGHRIVAVAARDRRRAETFAAGRGVERVHDTYRATAPARGPCARLPGRPG